MILKSEKNKSFQRSAQTKLTQKTIGIFIDQIYSKPPRKDYKTNKTDVYHFDDIWSLDILDLKGYGPERK